jgi:hypothetical protein
VYVKNIPLTSSEFHLHRLLDQNGIETVRIFLGTYSHTPLRYAFVGLTLKSDQPRALDILSRRVAGGYQTCEPYRNQKTRQDEPDFTDNDAPPYQNSKRHARQASEGFREVAVMHLRLATSRATIFDFFDSELGRGKVDYVEVKDVRFRGTAIAFVGFHLARDARDAILDCDGLEIDGRAVCVNWSNRPRMPVHS